VETVRTLLATEVLLYEHSVRSDGAKDAFENHLKLEILEGNPIILWENAMTTKKKIEVFSAGCSTCKETIELVKRIAGSSHDIMIHDMHQSEIASKAKHYGVRSVPAIVVDGKLAGCCAGRGPDEHLLQSALL
jgi:glutaredoxin